MKKIYIILLFSLLYTGVQAQPCAAPQSAPCDSCCYTCVRDYYWVGVTGTGNYEDPSNWNLDSLNGPVACRPPFTRDNVYFMADAFNTVGPDTVKINGNAVATCHNMYWDDNIEASQQVMFWGDDYNANILDIYGSIHLANKDSFDFKYNGHINLKSTDTLATLDFGEHQLNLRRLRFQGSDSTEFRLLSKFLVRNHAGSISGYSYNYGHGGFVELHNGLFNVNGQYFDVSLFSSSYDSDTTTGCRGLDISNSTVIVHGYRYAWNIDFDTTASANFCYFDASNSHVIINQIFPYNNRPRFGTGLHYDTITSNAPHLTFYLYNGEVNHLILNGSVNFPNTDLLVHNLYLQGGHVYKGYNSDMIVEAINVLGSCGDLATLEDFRYIKKETTGLLSFANTILSNITFDITGGRTYQANNSLDKGNVNNCTINGSIGRDLYFVDADDDQNWHNPNNWYRDSLGLRVPVHCIPSVFDNVFFDSASFVGSDTFVYANKMAHCQDMRWLSTVADSAYLQLGTSSYEYANIDIYGTLELASNMQFRAMVSGGSHPNTHRILFYGKKDSIIAKNKYIKVVHLEIMNEADYMISTTLHTNHLRAMGSGTIRTNNDTVYVVSAWMRKRYLNNAQYYFTSTSNHNSFRDEGQFVIDSSYTGNTTFHIRPFAENTAYFWAAGNLPNTIIYNTSDVRISGTNRLYVRGDLTLLEGGELPSYLSVLGDQPNFGGANLYSGNLTLTAGKEYIVKDVAGGTIEVENKFSAIGSCQKQIILRQEAGGTVAFDFNEPDSALLEYVYMEGCNNISSTTVDATECIDAVNNTNWNFVGSAGTTFYWRADKNDVTDFEGTWSDPNHWTTNIASLVGDSVCIPGPRDTVVFDSQSFSATSNGCEINETAFCKTIICTDIINIYGSSGQWYINESIHFYNGMQMDYSGDIYLVGSGVIESNSTAFQASNFIFQNPTGTWDLLDDFIIKNDYSLRYGVLQLIAGTLNTNNFDIHLDNRFFASGTQARTLNLGSSTVYIHDKGDYYSAANPREWVWNITDPSNMTLNAGTSTIILEGNQIRTGIRMRRLYMGDGLEYNNLSIYPSELCQLHGDATYNYLSMYGALEIYGNNTCDSIYVQGGNSYNFAGGSVQTLKSPYGRIVSNGNLSNYINFQSFPTGQKSYFHKEYGNAFCVDFLKVEDNEATKGVAPPLTVWDTLHQFLAFQTGVNSDNIGATATGIWEFNLPPLVVPTAGGDTVLNLCTSGNNSFPIELTGTSPYLIRGTWTDGGGGSGVIIDTILYDNDGNQNTPLSYNVGINSGNSSVTYVLDITTYRCGERRVATPVTIQVNRPEPNILVDAQHNSLCYLDNKDNWQTFVDDQDERPILSMNDYTGLGDNDSLKNVVINVDFDATTQYWNGYPYLVRNWSITPENNVGAKIRLYFTQEELDSLHAYTASPTSLDPANDIVVIKFASGVIGVGPGVVVPHTALTWNLTNSAPLSSTTNILGIECVVSSFSAFIIIPSYLAILPNDFVAFHAQANDNRTIMLDWEVENDENSKSFTLERSIDGIHFETIGELDAYSNGENTNRYSFLDSSPNSGTNYYRILVEKWTGELSFSSIKAVYLDGVSFFQIYPNPITNEQLNIRLETEQEREWKVTILDQLGKVVVTHNLVSDKSMQNYSISLGKLLSGIYILRMTDNKGQELRRKFHVK